MLGSGPVHGSAACSAESALAPEGGSAPKSARPVWEPEEGLPFPNGIVHSSSARPRPSLNPADLSEVTPEAHLFIFDPAEPLLLKRDVVLQVSQKRLHILHAPPDVCLDILHLSLGDRKPGSLIERKVIFDDLEEFRRNAPFLHGVKSVTAKLDGETFRNASTRLPIVEEDLLSLSDGAVNGPIDFDMVQIKGGKFLYLEPTFSGMGFQAIIDIGDRKS